MQQNGGRLPIMKMRLKELQGDMSATDFAKKVGLSRQTVGFYLNGDRIPDSETLIQICRSCNVSADWLLGLSFEKTVDSSLQGACAYTRLSADALTKVKNLPIASLRILNAILSDPAFSEILYLATYSYALEDCYCDSCDSSEDEAPENANTDKEISAAQELLRSHLIETMPYNLATGLYIERAKTLFGKMLEQSVYGGVLNAINQKENQ